MGNGGGRLGRGRQGGGGREGAVWTGSRSKDWRLELQEELELLEELELDLEEVELDCEREEIFFLDILAFRGSLNQLIKALKNVGHLHNACFFFSQPDTRFDQISS